MGFGSGELRTLAGTVFPAVSSSFCALSNLAGTLLSAVSGPDIVWLSSSQIDLGFEELSNLAGTVPAVFSSFCLLWNLAGTVLSAVSVSVFRNLI